MAKSKSKATVRVADGAGGMTKVQDHRFDTGEWPIQFQVASEHADAWMRYLNEECSRRGWSHSSFGQIDRSENSGSLTINAGQEQLVVVWERRRGRPIKVRARFEGRASELSNPQQFFDQVNDRCTSGATV